MLICKNCDNNIVYQDPIFCSVCNEPMHEDCKQQCNKCGAPLCDEHAIKNHWKCPECEQVDEYQMDFISSTMFESYLHCPYAFKHEHILKTLSEDERQNKYSVIGNVLHDIFEENAKIRPLPDVDDLIIDFQKSLDSMPDELFDGEGDKHEWREKGASIIENWHEAEQNKPIPLHVEKQHFIKLHTDLPEIRVTIDRINGKENDVENWEVEDYKTGAVYNSEKLRTNMQLPIYALAIQKIYGALPKSLKLYFPQHKQERVFERITDDIYVCNVVRGGTYSISLTQRLNQMVEIYTKIRKGDFKPNISNKHFCENFCALGKRQMCDGLSTQWNLLNLRGY